MKKVIALGALALFAQLQIQAQEVAPEAMIPDIQHSHNSEAFKHMDLSLTVGSTGIGFDLAMPVTEMIQLRAGATFMPRFEKTMRFGVQVGDYTQKDYEEKYLVKFDPESPKFDPEAGSSPMSFKDWMNAESNRRFEKLSGVMADLLGYQVDNKVDMIGQPTYNQAKLLADISPLNDKRWHFTAGFYIGGNRIAKAYNATYDMASLMGVATYNSMYYKALAEEPMISYGDINIFNVALNEKLKNYGRMSMHVGDFKHDFYATEDVYYEYTQVDPIFGEVLTDENGRAIEKGSLRFKKGEVMYKKGEPYNMVPDDDYMVKAEARVNAIRPFVGAGYGGYIDSDRRTKLSLDVGVLFWGGVPSVKTHDGVDLVNDLTDVKASIRKYLNVMKKFPVYPLIELRISQRLF